MKKVIWIISGGFLVLLGMYLIFNPMLALSTIAVLLGAVILAQGGAQVFEFVNYEERKEENLFGLFSAVLEVIFGVLIIFSPLNVVLASVLPAVFGLWIVAKGCMQCVKAAYLKQFGGDYWSTVLFFGVINFLVGILMLLNPFIPAFTIAFSFGLGLIMVGVSTLMVEF